MDSKSGQVRTSIGAKPSISHRRFGLIGIVLIAAIVGATVLFIRMQRDGAVAAYQAAIINLGNGMAQQTTGSIAAVDRALDEVRAQLTSAAATTPEGIKAFMQAETAFGLLTDLSKREFMGVDSLAVADFAGIIENSTGVGLFSGLDISDRDFFVYLRANDDRGPFVSVPTKSAVTDRWVWFLARRVNDLHGDFSGIVVAEYSLPLLEAFYRNAMPVRRTFSLLRKDGIVLFRYPVREMYIGKKISEQAPLLRVAAQGAGTYYADSFFEGRPVIAFVRALKNLPLVVQTSVSEKEVLVDWPGQTLWLTFGGVLTGLGVVLLLRHLARQVDRLEDSAVLLSSKNLELEAARSQFDAALSNISLGVCFFSSDGRLMVCNNRYREIYNLTPEATTPGTTFAEIVDQRYAAGTGASCTREEYILACAANVKTSKPGKTYFELINGRTILVSHQPMPQGGWVATHDDVTEQREANRHISFLAHNDVLTGLPNRAAYTEKIDEAVARLSRRDEPFAIFMMDLDKFKNVNDTLGHPAGDQLLREAAQRLKSSLRETDFLARLGGDEFAIIQAGEQHARDRATSLAERILKIIGEPFDLDGNLVTVGASIGIALAPEHAATGTELLKMADLALYAVKNAGRQGFRFFDAGMLTALQARHQTEEELRTAIERREFELHYQAMIDVRTSRQVGFEALVRWRHPTRGLVMPDDFIPLAEETGLIVPLGAWVLQQACMDAANWPAHIKVAVNLSPVQLSHPGLLDIVLCTLVESALPPERLELEITETALFKNDVDCVRLVRQFKQLGVSIALDDFGTGYSSLSYLTMIPFDKIKIDRSFTSNMTKRPECAAIVAAVLALGRSLKTETVTEGVETGQQLGIARDAGVSIAQGYLFGRPCRASDLVLDQAEVTELIVSAA